MHLHAYIVTVTQFMLRFIVALVEESLPRPVQRVPSFNSKQPPQIPPDKLAAFLDDVSAFLVFIFGEGRF